MTDPDEASVHRRGRRPLRSPRDGERGASAVEFALVVSLLVMLVFGIIQLGIAYHRQQGLEAAAREGARTASIGATQAEITDRIRAAQSLFTSTDVEVAFAYSSDDGITYTTIAPDPVNRPCRTAGIGQLVRVETRVPPPPSPDQNRYAISLIFVGNWNITYSALGVFRCEKNS